RPPAAFLVPCSLPGVPLRSTPGYRCAPLRGSNPTRRSRFRLGRASLLLPLPLRAEGDRPADGRRLRGVLAHHRVPEDLVQLEVVHPVVVAEVHLLRPGRAGGELVVLY